MEASQRVPKGGLGGSLHSHDMAWVALRRWFDGLSPGASNVLAVRIHAEAAGEWCASSESPYLAGQTLTRGILSADQCRCPGRRVCGQDVPSGIQGQVNNARNSRALRIAQRVQVVPSWRMVNACAHNMCFQPRNHSSNQHRYHFGGAFIGDYTDIAGGSDDTGVRSLD